MGLWYIITVVAIVEIVVVVAVLQQERILQLNPGDQCPHQDKHTHKHTGSQLLEGPHLHYMID